MVGSFHHGLSGFDWRYVETRRADVGEELSDLALGARQLILGAVGQRLQAAGELRLVLHPVHLDLG